MHKAGFAVLHDPTGKLMEVRRKPTRKEIIANDRVPCLKYVGITRTLEYTWYVAPT